MDNSKPMVFDFQGKVPLTNLPFLPVAIFWLWYLKMAFCEFLIMIQWRLSGEPVPISVDSCVLAGLQTENI